MRLSKKSARVFAASMCLAVAVTCTGCKSSEVKNAEKLINDIGTVSILSGDAIRAASSAYDELGQQKEKVENRQALADAENAYNTLIENATKPVCDAIAAIPQPVTVDASDSVSNALSLYNKLPDDVKSFVSNADILTTAQTTLDDIAVQSAIDAINQIGDVSLNSQDAIDAATSAFQKVPSARRADVSNYDTLVAATSTMNQLKSEAAEAAGKAALSRLKKSTDEVEGTTWYKPSCYPRYSNSRSFVLPYIGEKGGSYWLRCKVDYTANDWVFFDRIIINVDGVKRDTITFEYFDVTRDTVVGGKLWEAADFAPTDSQIKLLGDIADSKKTIIRFQGNDYYYDMTVSKDDKQGIKDVLAAYDYVK